jgi:integrase
MLQAKQQEFDSGRTGRPKAVALSEFTDLYAEHLRVRNRRPTTIVSARAALKLLRQFVGDILVDEIDPADCEAFLDWRAKETVTGRKLSPHTCNKERRTLHAAFAWAAKHQRFVDHNPFADVDLLQVDRADPVRIPTEVVRQLLDGSQGDARLHAWLYLSVLTGMRAGELEHLDFCDVDWDSRTARLHPKAGWAGPKGRRNRILPIDDHAAALLRRLQVRNRGQCVFEADQGGRWGKRRALEAFVRLQKRLGVANTDGRTYTLHNLRSTLNTALFETGAGAAVACDMLGHSSVQVNEEHYRAVTRVERLREAQQKLPYRHAM